MSSSVAAPRSSAIDTLSSSSVLAAIRRQVSGAKGSGLMIGAVFAIAASIWILAGLGGFDYYRTPLAVRAYVPAHRILRPSGPGGQMFGVVGTLLMLVPFLYVARKHLKPMKNIGSIRGWLEVHLFCGLVGPILITFHTTFKFNGVVSAAYWSMVLVMLSGFVGRFLFVRIPKTIRGVELTRTELEARSDALRHRLTGSVGAAAAARPLESFEHALAPVDGSLADLFFGEFRVGHRVRRLESDLKAARIPMPLRQEVVEAAVERGLLLRRIAHLQKTKWLFGMWHVFHMPLVFLMLVIVVAHVGVVLYLGYVPFRW